MDASFLISLYSPDANSIGAAQMMQASKNTHLVSTFTELEGRVLCQQIGPGALFPDSVEKSQRILGMSDARFDGREHQSSDKQKEPLSVGQALSPVVPAYHLTHLASIGR